MLAPKKDCDTMKDKLNKFFIDEDGLTEFTAEGSVIFTESYCIVDGKPMRLDVAYATKNTRHCRY